MSLTFRSIPPTFEDFQVKRRDLERQEVKRGLLMYLLRTTTLVMAGTGFIFSSLVLWRRYHPQTSHPSGWLSVCCVLLLQFFSLWFSLWEFRRKQQRVHLRAKGTALGAL